MTNKFNNDNKILFTFMKNHNRFMIYLWLFVYYTFYALCELIKKKYKHLTLTNSNLIYKDK